MGKAIAVQPLNVIERKTFTDCCKVIDKGLRDFLEVGNALWKIDDGKLYRETHKQFTSFCRERWGFEKSQAYRLIDSAKVVSNLSPIGDNLMPINESQARPLTNLPPEQQVEVWQDVLAESKEKLEPITAGMVEEAVKRATEAAEPYVEPVPEEEPEEVPTPDLGDIRKKALTSLGQVIRAVRDLGLWDELREHLQAVKTGLKSK